MTISTEWILFFVSCIGCIVGIVSAVTARNQLRIAQENAKRDAAKHSAEMARLRDQQSRETAAEIEARARRDTHLERDSKETKATAERIEAMLGGVSGKIDKLSSDLTDLTGRVVVLEGQHTTMEEHLRQHDKQFHEVLGIQAEDAEMYVADHKRKGSQ